MALIDAFASVFVAEAPRPELAEHLAPFAPLTGSFDACRTADLH
jgi:hypothetical protein